MSLDLWFILLLIALAVPLVLPYACAARPTEMPPSTPEDEATRRSAGCTAARGDGRPSQNQHDADLAVFDVDGLGHRHGLAAGMDGFAARRGFDNDDDFGGASHWISDINPASGLPMAGTVDLAGNPYGSNLARSSLDHHGHFGSSLRHDWHDGGGYRSTWGLGIDDR